MLQIQQLSKSYGPRVLFDEVTVALTPGERLGLIGPKVPAELAHDILESSVASEDVFAFHTYLIQHGRKV
ncbi:MAG: hypothetical protein DSZ35_05690, partial [Verrucomicrobia bacterium]